MSPKSKQKKQLWGEASHAAAAAAAAASAPPPPITSQTPPPPTGKTGRNWDAAESVVADAIAKATGTKPVDTDPFPIESWFQILNNPESREFGLVTVMFAVAALPSDAPTAIETRIRNCFHKPLPVAAGGGAGADTKTAPAATAAVKAAAAGNSKLHPAQLWIMRLVGVLNRTGDDLFPGSTHTIKSVILEGLSRLQAIEIPPPPKSKAPAPVVSGELPIGQVISSTPGILDALILLIKQPAISGVKVLIHAVEYVGTLIATACRDCTVSEEAANMKAESKQPQTVITLDPTPYEKHLEYWMVSCELLNRLVDVIAYSNQLLGAKKQADRNRSPSADLIAPHVQALWVMCSMALATIANVNKYLKAIADSKVLFAVRSLVCSTEGLMYPEVILNGLRIFSALSQEEVYRARVREVLSTPAAAAGGSGTGSAHVWWIPILAYKSHSDKHIAMAAHTVLFAAPFAKVTKTGSGRTAQYELTEDESWITRADRTRMAKIIANAKRIYSQPNEAFNPDAIDSFSAEAEAKSVTGSAAATASAAAAAPLPAGASYTGRSCGNPRCGKKEITGTSDAVSYAACGACKSVYYCSKDCQKVHWKDPVYSHKLACSLKSSKPPAAPTTTTTTTAVPVSTVTAKPTGVTIEEVDS